MIYAPRGRRKQQVNARRRSNRGVLVLNGVWAAIERTTHLIDENRLYQDICHRDEDVEEAQEDELAPCADEYQRHQSSNAESCFTSGLCRCRAGSRERTGSSSTSSTPHHSRREGTQVRRSCPTVARLQVASLIAIAETRSEWRRWIAVAALSVGLE